MLDWHEPRDMVLAPRDGRQILLLLSNGWLTLASYPEEDGRLPAADRWNVWWQCQLNVNVLDEATSRNPYTGIRAVGWWNVPDRQWCWETATNLRKDIKLEELPELP